MRWLFLAAIPALLACNETSVTVIGHAPEVKILLPADDAAYVHDLDTVVLEATAGDRDQLNESLSAGWLSDLDGSLWSGSPAADGLVQAQLPAEALVAGDHLLTFRATDSDGNTSTDQVSIRILPADAPPEVEITAPDDGAAFDHGTSITFQGEAFDARDLAPQLAYEWDSDRYGVLDDGHLSSAGTTSWTTSDLDEGWHTLTLRVTDTQGQAGEAEVAVEVLHVNVDPVAVIGAPMDGDSSKQGTTVVMQGQAVDSEDDPEDLWAAWSSSLDGVICEEAPDSDGKTSCTTSSLSVGDHVLRLAVTDPDGGEGTASVRYTVTEENTPPGAPTIEISPSSPTTTDDITVAVTADAVDVDGDPVTYTWQWYRDSALMSGYTTDTVSSSDTAKDETWMVEVTPHDGEDAGTLASASVTVVNTPPSITSVSLTPTTAYTTDTLECTPSGWSDDDGDSEGYAYAWTVDGAAVTGTSSTLSGVFSRNEDVVCTVTPDDGDDTGTAVSSSAVTILNSPPDPPEISIDPAYPVTTDDLAVVEDVAASDDDGDTLTTTYTWSVDGSTSSSHTTDTVSASDTALEETWSVTVTVDDGDDTATSDAVEVRIWPDTGDLIFTEIMANPDAVTDNHGEYAELYNTTSTDISLDDHFVLDLDYDIVDLSGYTIAAGGTFVLCADTDSTANGGVTTCDHEVTWSTGSTTGTNQLTLSNTGDELVAENDAVTIDEVVYTSSWVSTGAATGLDTAHYDDTDNDDLSNWCDQTTTLSGGDAGTPGATNDGC